MAVANAATAGINASDAICISRLGEYPQAEEPSAAAGFLSGAVPEDSKVVATLRRLLALKGRSQYGRRPIETTSALAAVRQARLLVEFAEKVLRD